MKFFVGYVGFYIWVGYSFFLNVCWLNLVVEWLCVKDDLFVW